MYNNFFSKLKSVNEEKQMTVARGIHLRSSFIIVYKIYCENFSFPAPFFSLPLALPYFSYSSSFLLPVYLSFLPFPRPFFSPSTRVVIFLPPPLSPLSPHSLSLSHVTKLISHLGQIINT